VEVLINRDPATTGDQEPAAARAPTVGPGFPAAPVLSQEPKVTAHSALARIGYRTQSALTVNHPAKRQLRVAHLKTKLSLTHHPKLVVVHNRDPLIAG
jgi:hypothetical protein